MINELPHNLRLFLTCYQDTRKKLGLTGAPRQKDLPLREMAPILPEFDIVERSPEGDLVYRLIGTEVEKRFGPGYTKRPFRELGGKGNQALALQGLEIIAPLPCGVLWTSANRFKSGIELKVAILSLPLTIQDGEAVPSGFASCHAPLDAVPPFREDDDVFVYFKPLEFQYVDLGNGVPEVPFGV